MRNFVPYINYNYQGGQNDTDIADQLMESEGVRMRNCYIRNKGQLIKRNGTILTGNDTSNLSVNGLFYWKTDAGTKYFLKFEGTTLYYLNGSTWDALDTGFTTGTDMSFAAANGVLYMCNGTENIHSWDGASVVTNACLTDLGAAVPKGKQLIWWRNYMFVSTDSSLGATSYPARVWFSNLNTPGTWTTGTDYFDANKSDGQVVTGIGILEKFFAVFKERSTFVMTGNTPSQWRIDGSNNNLQNVDQGFGCVSYKSIVQVGNDLWFMSNGGIRSLIRNEQGTTPFTGLVSGDVQTTIDGANKSQLSKSSAIMFDGRVYFAFASGTSTYNDTVIVADTTINKGKPFNPFPWVVYTGWNPNVWAVYTPSSSPQLYWGHGNNGVVFQAEVGSDDNDEAIDFDYISPAIDLKNPDRRKTHRFMYVDAQSGGNYNVNIEGSTDGNTFTLLELLNLSSGALWDTGIWGVDTWGFSSRIREKVTIQKAGYQYYVRFRNNEANEPVTMYPYSLAIKPKEFK